MDGDNCLEYYDNGILYRCGQYKDNIPNGYIYEYYPTGVLKRQGVFVNGILNGSFCKEYHEAGNLKFKGAMENGMYNGASLIYYKSGLLKYCGNCKNGLPEGDNALIFNNKNGNIKYQGSLLNGLYHGQGQLYNDSKSSEVPIYDGLFIKGKFVDGKVYTFHPNNNVEYYGNFKNGNFEGRGIMYHATGKRMYHGKYKKGLEHNREVVIYDENGNISLICDEIADGKIIGGVEAYAKNDKDVAYEGTYNDQARMSIEKDVFPIEMMTQQRPKKK